MTHPTQLWAMGACELAELVRTRQASAREVVRAHLDRIDRVNPLVNAITVVLAEQALAAADAADEALRRGEPPAPLTGVPMTVKENVECCGVAALKPSLGRVPQGGRHGPSQPAPFAFQLLAVHGPIARQVRDLRLAFAHMCGDRGSDPWYAPVPLDGPPVQTPVRVSVVTDPAGEGTHPACGRRAARGGAPARRRGLRRHRGPAARA